MSKRKKYAVSMMVDDRPLCRTEMRLESDQLATGIAVCINAVSGQPYRDLAQAVLDLGLIDSDFSFLDSTTAMLIEDLQTAAQALARHYYARLGT